MIQRMRKVTQRIVDETDRAQALAGGDLIARGLESGERLVEEIKRRAVVLPQLRVTPLLIQRLWVYDEIGQVRGHGGHVGPRVTHARPRPGNHRTSPRVPCRSAPAT